METTEISEREIEKLGEAFTAIISKAEILDFALKPFSEAFPELFQCRYEEMGISQKIKTAKCILGIHKIGL